MFIRRMAATAATLVIAFGVTAGVGPALAGDSQPEDSQAKTWAVNCDAGETITKTIAKVRPGDVISVVGACFENVVVPQEASRVVLDGNGSATITGPDSALDVVAIYADDLTIRGFTITGGRGGINLRGALGVSVEDNTIVATTGVGLTVHRMSYALIVNNRILQNSGHGILLMENSSARIGFKETGAAAASPNTIEGNGADGIYIARSSNAWVAGNRIAGNGRNGVYIEKTGQAEVMANTIEGNRGHGVVATHNSGAHLGSGTGTRWLDKPNTSTVPNGGYAVQCSIGAYVVGQVASLSGTLGTKSIASGCVDMLQ